MVALRPQFRQMHCGQAMVIIDMTQVKYRYLQGRDTQLLRDRQAGKTVNTGISGGLELLTDKTYLH